MSNISQAAARALPGDTDANRSGARITMNMLIASMLAWVVYRAFGIKVDASDPAFVLLAPVVAGIFYRASRVLSAWKPALGWILFGDGDQPSFSDRA